MTNGKWYVGFTSDLKRRLIQHNQGQSLSTKAGLPWELVYCEGYKSQLDALNREKKLKHHAKGMQMLKARLVNSCDLMAKR